MTRVDNSLTEMIVGKWIHADTDGETVTTDMKSVYTFEKNGDELKGYYSMSMTESGVWAYRQETGVTISGNDLRFTAKTTLSKNAAPTAPPTPSPPT